MASTGKGVSGVLVIALMAVACATATPPKKEAGASEEKELRLVLVTIDGLRWQELFMGMDPELIKKKEKSGVRYPDRVQERFGGATPDERKKALFPFFWGTLAQQGVVLGDRRIDSSFSVLNPHRTSYPGYAELLTGRVLTHIESNKPVPIGVPTILDFLQNKWSLSSTDVALFASWERFQVGASNTPGAFLVNAGYQDVPRDVNLEGAKDLMSLQKEMLTPWDDVRHDKVTTELAIRFIRRYRPRVLYLSLGETDDWAHERRYDRVLQSARRFDDSLAQLWAQVNALDEYRDNTIWVITTDHGRGVTDDDWISHKAKIPRSHESWAYFFGPGVPALGALKATKPATLSQIAPTILRLLKLDPTEYHQGLSAIIEEATPTR